MMIRSGKAKWHDIVQLLSKDRKWGCAHIIIQDGDQTTVKGVFSEEANEELAEQLNSKAHFFTLGGRGIRKSDKEAMQSLYNLTLCLDADKSKLSDPIF